MEKMRLHVSEARQRVSRRRMGRGKRNSLKVKRGETGVGAGRTARRVAGLAQKMESGGLDLIPL